MPLADHRAPVLRDLLTRCVNELAGQQPLPKRLQARSVVLGYNERGVLANRFRATVAKEPFGRGAPGRHLEAGIPLDARHRCLLEPETQPVIGLEQRALDSTYLVFSQPLELCRGPDLVGDLGGVDGLGQKIDRPRRQRIHAHFAIPARRHHHDRKRGEHAQAIEIREHGQPVDVGHPHVEKHQVDRFAFDDRQRLGAALRDPHLTVLAFGQFSEKPSVDRIVVHDQDSDCAWHG